MTATLIPDRRPPLAALVLAALAASLFVSLPRVAHSAPVPPPPKELTAEMMTGRWDYEWNQHPNGTLWLHADGSYTARHAPGARHICHGTWAVAGGTLTLTEWVFDTEWSADSGPATYVYEFKARDYPRLKGTSNGSGTVALSGLKRE